MKKKMIVILIILIIIAIIIGGIYYLYKKKKPQDPFEIEWVRIYYDYMKENHEKLKLNQNGLKYYRENEKIEFCNIENLEYPVMLYNYKELGVVFTNIFYINENKSVEILKPSKKEFDVEILYDLDGQKYDYYIHEAYNDKNSYTKISEAIKANNEQDKEKSNNILTFGIEEKNSVTTLEGKVIEIFKFDQKFIETNVIEKNWKDINFNNYEEAIKKDFGSALIKMENALNEETEKYVNEKKEKIEEKKEEMIKAIEEIERKKQEEEEARIKAEEEAKRKAEEEAKKAEEKAKKKAEEEKKRQEENNNNNQEQESEQNENYTLKYGTYKGEAYWTEGDPLSKYEITITLKQDGTYVQVNSSTATQSATQTYSGKFTINKVEGVGLFIIFSVDEEPYQITGNNEFTSNKGAVIKYQGN